MTTSVAAAESCSTRRDQLIPLLNLGIKTFLNGSTSSPQAAVQIDTSQPGTHTIDYVVADPTGLTATSTRTIIVSAPANDNSASSTPTAVNDNAATLPTAASSTAQ